MFTIISGIALLINYYYNIITKCMTFTNTNIVCVECR